MHTFRKLRSVVLISSSIFALNAQASLLTDPSAMITAGNSSGELLPDEVLDGLRDPNTLDSPFNGVVSIATVIDGQQYICSGTLISDRHVLTAGHCVDESGQGDVIDLNNPDSSLSTIFNRNGDASTTILASAVTMHTDYNGFYICSDGGYGCVNDDLAIIELAEDAPAEVTRYEIYGSDVLDTASYGSGDVLHMVGYGRHGDGTYGYYDQYDDAYSASYTEKYRGANIVDLVDYDDEGTGARELFYTDFDGYDAYLDESFDPFCYDFGICSEWLADGSEAGLGGGDSGGASFVWDEASGSYLLAGVNTFTMDWSNVVEGSFGLISGGILLHSYSDWIYETISSYSVPEPQTLALFLIGLFGLTQGARRNRKVLMA